MKVIMANVKSTSLMYSCKRTFLRKARESALLAAPVVTKSLDNI